jgi:aspartyl-tRNA(Asn)/glutamyl-tRNA(Gln) amidotransferase subunit C
MVDDSFVTKTAKLAGIVLKPNEVVNLRKDLTDILTFMSKLAAVPTEGLKPMTTPVLNEAPLRGDAVHQDASQEEILKNAPQKREGFFILPRVL